jgi:hypothetical protein
MAATRTFSLAFDLKVQSSELLESGMRLVVRRLHTLHLVWFSGSLQIQERVDCVLHNAGILSNSIC